MTWQPPKGMDEYLNPTKLCDCDDAELKEKAKEIIRDAETRKEAALKIFYFVREQISFGMDYADVKASRTLKKEIGFCFTKTNLHIALLRAIGIPARCHYVHLNKELLKDIAPRFMYNRMPFITHPWPECCLSEEWLACEALDNEESYKARLRMGIITKEEVPTIDWDGEINLILHKPWIIKDVGTFPSIDDVLIEGRRRGEPLPPTNKLFGWFGLFLINRRINEIRKKWAAGYDFSKE